ncbi:hypothetical protein [Streptomyces sp. NPDC059166]|uniref:hypothetical protein n=1 Tax=Streptomyces sp. NPDC059166 TaxID=3346752 RepID=UPI0036C830AD
MSVHLKPRTGKEITLDDLRELVRKTDKLPGRSPIVAVCSSKTSRVESLDIEIVE